MQFTASRQLGAQWMALREATKRRWFALPPELRAPRTLIALGLGLAAVFLIAGAGILVLALSFASALRARGRASAAPPAPVGQPGD